MASSLDYAFMLPDGIWLASSSSDSALLPDGRRQAPSLDFAHVYPVDLLLLPQAPLGPPVQNKLSK